MATVLFPWSDKYSLGIPSIDQQHKKLVGMLNELFDAMKEARGNDVLGKTLNGLIDYTKTHFAYEERLMQQHAYQDFVAHKERHDELTKQVLETADQFAAGRVGLSTQTAQFLKEWLASHIMGTDKEYAPLLKSKGVA
jgi:hemerythrin